MFVRLLKCLPAALLALTLGCGDDGGHDHDGHDHGDHVHDDSGNGDDAFAGLTAEEQKLAKAQKMCPVSDEELGSMGTPIKETWQGKTVFFCCEACRKPFLKDPAKYVAKLKE